MEFLKLARDHARVITGSTLCQLAREEAKDLKIEDFEASDGWLSKFKARHGVKARCLSRESKS